MALVFLATMTVAGGAFLASRAIKSRPGGMRLFLQRKNIQLSHRLGLIDDLQAAGAYESLRRTYAKLVKAKPLVLFSSLEEAPQRNVALHYTGPFRSEMTRYEARMILGLSEEEVKNSRGVTRRWRSMMLKNHPDTGGSPFVASKINEAKEIVLGEKAAREGGPNDEEEVNNWEDDELTEEEKRLKRKHEGRNDLFDSTTPAPEETNPDLAPHYYHPAPPFYKWEREKAEELPTMVAPINYWNMKQDMFHRKATRTKPNWRPIDNPQIFPRETWKDDYMQELQDLEEQEVADKKDTVEYVKAGITSTGDELGRVMDHEGKSVPPEFFTHTEERRAAWETRVLRRDLQGIDVLRRNLNVRRARHMAEIRAEARRATERYKKSMAQGSM